MGKNIVITGASRGIGFAMTQAFLEAGHRVVALSRNAAPLEALNHPNCFVVAVDLSLEQEVIEAGALITQELNHIDALIHNAGKLINKPFKDIELQEVKEVYAVNVFGPMMLTKQLLPCMDHQTHVVSISSMGGVNGTAKFPGLSAYSSSKGALTIWSEVMAEEHKDNGPKFNTLALGAVQTEMLSEAFPDYQAPMTAGQMAKYIVNFALEGHHIFNGKTLNAAQSTP